jgi:general secretion pathway protein J
LNQRGFTLLEIIVAIGIFAILWALTFGGWQSVQRMRGDTERQATRLSELEITMSFLTRDLSEAVDRQIRDEYGGLKPAIQGGAGSVHPLELTRAGWRNPAGQPRSALQRVAYSVTDEKLVRHAWRVLDRAQDSAPVDARLLTGVRGFKLRFLDGRSRQWVQDWPPPAQGTATSTLKPPLAVELTIDLEDMGTVGRIFRLPG